MGKSDKKPIAVLISDVHYSLPTLELADTVMQMAINKANELDIDLIVAGDLHDTKANLRAECINRMMNTFRQVERMAIILRGNHCALNEKSKESSVQFLHELKGISCVNDNTEALGMYFVPYNHDTETLKVHLKTIPKGSTVIMHQGIKSANSGEYGDFDKTALVPIDLAGLRVISGHYHTRQTIVLPDGGQFDYIGNPYTLNYGEAGDPPKGFQILYADGSLEFIPTNLRKHIVFNMVWNEIGPQTILVYNPEDLLWLKISGPKEKLAIFSRDRILNALQINATQVRIDLTATDSMGEQAPDKKPQSDVERLDDIIDSATYSAEQKERLKSLWRTIL